MAHEGATGPDPTAKADQAAKPRAEAGTPRRVLCLDGGGVRTAAQLGLLAALEESLVRRSYIPDFRLSDYFDLIVGSSAGAMIAAGLALGRPVADIEAAWTELGPLLTGAKPAAAAEQALATLFGAGPLARAAFRTRFGAFLKRRSDGAVLFVTDRAPPEDGALLHRVVAAACAGGPKLETEKVALVEGGPVATYVDATAAGLADPTLALVRALAAQGGGLDWPLGPDKMLVMSVGAGRRSQATGKWTFVEAMAQDAAAAAQETLLGITEGAWRPSGVSVRLAHLPMLRYERFDADLGPEPLASSTDPEPLRAAGVAAFEAAAAAVGEAALFPKSFNTPGFGKRPLGPPKIRLEALGRAFDRRGEG